MIFFAGDPHSNFSHLAPVLKKFDRPALIILGDLNISSDQILQDLIEICDVWFIHGNHDSKSIEVYKTIWGEKWKARNLHGRVQEIQGKRFAGLGGVFRGQIWMPPNKPLFFDPIHYCQYCQQEELWEGGLPLRHRTSIFPSDIEQLELLQADVLICHEAPKPHPLGFEVINQLATKMGVEKIIHGHHHENYPYQNTNQFPKIYNVGFRSLMNEAGDYLILGKDDE